MGYFLYIKIFLKASQERMMLPDSKKKIEIHGIQNMLDFIKDRGKDKKSLGVCSC